MRDIYLFLHILAVAAWIGGGLTIAFLMPRMQKSGAPVARAFFSSYEAMGKLYFNIAGITVLVTGALLVIESELFDWENTFVVIGIVVVILGALLGAIGFSGTARKMVAAYDDDDDAAIGALTRRFSLMGGVDTVLLVVALIGMVYKWGV